MIRSGIYSETGGSGGEDRPQLQFASFVRLLNTSNVVMTMRESNVGIGTTTPSYLLDVSGGARITTQLAITPAPATDASFAVITSNFIGTRRVYFGSPANSTAAYGGAFIDGAWNTGNGACELAFYTRAGGVAPVAPVEYMRITSNGNVGIGTTAPAYALDVCSGSFRCGSDILAGPISNYAIATWNVVNSLAVFGSYNTADTTIRPIQFRQYVSNANFTRMLIDACGNVGIGNVSNSTVNALLTLRNPTSYNTVGNLYDMLSFQTNYKTRAEPSSRYIIRSGVYNEPSTGTDLPQLQFASFIGLTSTSTPVLTLQQSNVGIGTVAPGYTLDVSGQLRVTSNVGIGTIPSSTTRLDISGGNIVHRGQRDAGGYANIYLNVITDGSYNTAGLHFQNLDNGTSTSRSQTAGSRLSLGAGNNTNNNLTISNGYVGIGLTNPSNMLDVCGDIVVGGVDVSNNLIRFRGVAGDTGSNMTVIAERIYSNTSDRSELVLFKGNDPDSISGPDRVRIRAGEFRFQTIASSETWATLGDDSNRMVINSNGFVGIGTAFPLAALDISGQGVNFTIGRTGASASTDGLLIQGYSNAGFIRPQAANSTLYLGTSNSNWVILNSSGYLGIGLGNPQYGLDVSGTGVSGVGRFLRSVGIGKDPDWATFALDVNGLAQATQVYGRSTDSNYNLITTADSTSGGIVRAYRRSGNPNYTNLTFQTGNNDGTSTCMTILGSNGVVGIGTTTPSNGTLHVDTSLSVSIPIDGEQLTNVDNCNWIAASSNPVRVSIYAKGSVWVGSNVIVTSDQRIKRNIQDISDGDALSKIRLIEPKTYQYIENERGNKYVYGFLAQQVSNVLPYSTTLQTKPVPDIYDVADICGTRLTLRNKDVSCGDANVHYITDDFQEKRYWTRFIDSRTLDVSMDVSDSFPGEKVYVYGRVVNDFHVLDKNAIYTVGIAALQEVDRQVQRQQATIDQLTAQIANLTARLTQLEANNGS